MYLRWKRNRRSSSAVLVESVRVNGRPRQRYIAYLGSLSAESVAWWATPPAGPRQQTR
jgi:hypothetical protein